MSNSQTHSRAGTKSNGKNVQKMSTKVILGRVGLVEYYQFFERSGYQMFAGDSHPTDFQVEQILAHVENQCCVEFEAEIRVKLWKALRYQWFRGPGHGQEFVERNKVDKIALPKRDYKQIDWMVKFAEMDSDRQRQIIRKTRPCESSGRGPGVQTLQFEVFRRQKDLWYEFKDLQRCVVEWQRKNPRTMLREDPREEVLKIRVRNIMDLASAQMNSLRAGGARQRQIGHILLVIQIIYTIMCGLMFFVAYYRYRNTPRQIIFSFVVSSQQFISGVMYFVAMMVAYTVGQRRHADSMEMRYQKLIYSCERLTEQISDFRVETEDIRLLKQEAPTADLVKPGAPPPKEQRAKPKKRKKKVDHGLAMWAPDYGKTDPEEHAALITKAIEESYKFLPPLPDNFKPQGGERMGKHLHRMGGINEDALIHVSRGRGDDHSAIELLRLQGGFDLPPLPGPRDDDDDELPASFPQPLPLIPPLAPPVGNMDDTEADFAATLTLRPDAPEDAGDSGEPPATPPGDSEMGKLDEDGREIHLHKWMPGYVGLPDLPEAACIPEDNGPRIVTLRVDIIRATGLYNADGGLQGKSDPYCICSIAGKKKPMLKTKTVNDNLNPVWNFKGEIAGFDMSGDELEFVVWDSDWGRDDLLGKARMHASSMNLRNGGVECSLNLTDCKHAQGELTVAIFLTEEFAAAFSNAAPQMPPQTPPFHDGDDVSPQTPLGEVSQQTPPPTPPLGEDGCPQTPPPEAAPSPHDAPLGEADAQTPPPATPLGNDGFPQTPPPETVPLPGQMQ